MDTRHIYFLYNYLGNTFLSPRTGSEQEAAEGSDV